MQPGSPVTHMSLPSEITRTSVQSVSWWNQSNQPLQDNQNVRIEICTAQLFQTWTGFGCAVSELGMQALSRLPAAEQARFFQAMYGPEGAHLTWIRLPIGASDFALGSYSASETAEDFEQQHFSLARDRQWMIPYIRAAQAANPTVRVHASPWSPPGWMKQSGRMDGVEQCELRDEPRVLAAYARYLRLFLQGYAAEGIKIDRLMVQNEMDSPAPFPSCKWTPELFVRFHLEYLKPEFAAHGITTEVWGGTFRTMTGLQSHECFRNPAYRAFVKGAAFQYSYPKPIEELQVLYPGIGIMHTETVCHGGANTANEAAGQFDDFLGYAGVGADLFTYWNSVLAEDAASTWGWKQNAMCTAHAAQQQLVLNPDYDVFRLLSRNLRPGAVRLRCFSQLLSALCFRNPDGRLCLLLRNLEEARQAEVTINGVVRRVDLPGHALCALSLEG